MPHSQKVYISSCFVLPNNHLFLSKGCSKMRLLKINLCLFLLLFCAGSVSAFVFNGTIADVNGVALNNTVINITIWIMGGQGPQYNSCNSTTSNESGWFSVNVTDGSSLMYKPIITHTNTTGNFVDYVGQALPTLPYSEFSTLSNISFYLKDAGTINITAINNTGEYIPFGYILKDTKLGYEVSMSQNSSATGVAISVPKDRNYSIMVFPPQVTPSINFVPVSFNWNNFSATVSYNITNNNGVNLSRYDATAKTLHKTFNVTESFAWVSGYINDSGIDNWTNLTIIPYVLEPSNMIFMNMGGLPYNASAWRGSSDSYDLTTGFYNITLPYASAETVRYLLFAAATNGSEYRGSFRNITITGDVTNINFSMYGLLGDVSVMNMSDSMGGARHIAPTKKQAFNLVNSSGSIFLSITAHTETRVDYSSYDAIEFTFMEDLSSAAGTFYLPLLNLTGIKNMMIYSADYAPKKIKKSAAQIKANNSITLAAFNPGGISETIDSSGITIELYRSNSSCDAPNPPSGCLLDSATSAAFNPLSTIIGGGDLSFRMSYNNITVHYKKVDLLASGPPDAMFDSSGDENSSGANLEAAWRFGSAGPDIYDEVLVGIPYDSTVDESAPFSILLTSLYDNDWDVVWNSTSNPNGENYKTVADGDYADYNQSWLNSSSGGMPCSISDQTANCFVNRTNNMIWLKIPHFSGIGPTVKSTSIGGVNMTASESTINCTTICVIHINVTNSNYTLSADKQNITINTSDVLGYVNTFNISWYNGSDFVFNATNSTLHQLYNFTLYNATSTTTHQYMINISKSSRKNEELNFTYNISGMGSSPLSVYIALRGDIPSTAPTLFFVNDTDKDGNMELNWTDDGNETSENYTIYRYANTTINAPINVTNFGNATAIKTGIPSGTQFFEDNTTIHGVKYFYALVTVDRYGRSNTSVLSASLNATANDTIAPAKGAGLNGTLAIGSGTTNNQINLRWSNTSTDVSGNSEGNVSYVIYYKSSSSAVNTSPTDGNLNTSGYSVTYNSTANSTSFSCTDCTSATIYHFFVTTLDDGGNVNLSVTTGTGGNYLNTSLIYTAESTSSSSSGGGGGGGGSSSTTSAGVSASKMWSVLAIGTSTMTVSKSAIAVTSVVLNMKNQVSNAEVTVTKLNEKPSSLSKPTGETYQYIRIDKTAIKDADFENVKIQFKVTKSWLKAEGINEGDVALYKYTTRWIKLSTKKIKSESDYVSYEATTSGFSNFAIVGKKAGIKTATLTGEDELIEGREEAVNESAAEEAEEEKKVTKGKSWVGWTIVSSVVIIGLILYFWWSGKRRRSNAEPNEEE